MTEEYRKYFYDQMGLLADAKSKSLEKQESFFQQILIVSSGILGIIVALHGAPQASLYIRLVFVSATVLLSLCILTTSMVLYDLSKAAELVCEAFRIELKESLQRERKMDPVFVPKKKRTVFCEKCSLISLPVSLILLVVYTAVITI